MTTQDDDRGYRHPEAPWGGWQDTLVSTIRGEIDRGMIVRIVLPGLAKPVVVEDAGTELSMVVLADQHGYRFYIGSMAGVVVLASPVEGKGTGLWYPETVTPHMSVDDHPEHRSQ
jgi:hypothetical protein